MADTVSIQTHPYSFDPTYVFSLERLLAIQPPKVPDGFERFWKTRYERALEVTPMPELKDTGRTEAGYRILDCWHTSTNGARLGGWLALPKAGDIRRGIVWGHGYGGREAPDLRLRLPGTAILFPCSRGISRSPAPPVSSDPQWHVLHNIQDSENYIHGFNVEDVWCSVSALLRLFPEVAGHLAYYGVSFTGGIGAMALPWDDRIASAHFIVPSFGHNELRMSLPTFGSGASVQAFLRRKPTAADRTLALHDAAVAATFIRKPVHCACALFDPMVCPPGQFAIYNALAGQKELFVLSAGHFEYPQREAEETAAMSELEHFWNTL